MLKLKKISAFVASALAVSTLLTACHDKPAQVDINKDFNSKASYAVGFMVGQNFLSSVIDSQKGIVDYNQDALLQGVKDALNKKAQMTEEDVQKMLQDIQTKLENAAVKEVEDNNQKLVADFKQKDGVKETKSGLLYRIENPGEGENIHANDLVKVEYTGKLGNGEVFDSSEKHGPVEFPLNQVIAGWTEGLQLVKKGGEIELVIPAKLAYGDNAMGPIPAHSNLYFHVKVLDVKPQ